MKAFEKTALNILRIAAGLLFMEHGAQKLFGWFGHAAVPTFISQLGLAGGLEFFGGLLIVTGLFTRPVAALLLVEMLWAYGQVHLSRGLVPIVNGGERALLYAAIYLFLAAAGGGDFSVDGVLRKRRR
ncbi:MAG TPA: DoxX family protein [Longimicrobiales bacterium]|nr:DoxX family protein [Longimicrobiales bacterium]